ncbi:MAG: serine/threonine-protein phosphatase [Candidatus Solibacter usitatus]|nr:serine/threonine-protein phosphatase [Candidatus Solibacter usitatus]
MMRLLCLLCLSLPALAQSVLTVTATGCVYKEGDDAVWAQKNFDDRDWSPARPDLERLATSPYLWVRCRLDLRPLVRTGPVSVQVQAEAAWEMFLDGESAGSFGDIRTGRFSMDIAQHRLVPEKLAGRDNIIVALRVVERGRPAPGDGRKSVFIQAGTARTLDNEALRTSADAIANRFYAYLLSGLLGAAGLFLLILSGTDRSRRDLFWLGVNCLSLGMLRLNELAQVLLVPYPDWFCTLVFGAAGVAVRVGQVWFCFVIADRRVPVAYRLMVHLVNALYSVAVLASLFGSLPLSQLVVWWTWFEPPVREIRVLLMAATATAAAAAFWPYWRVPKELRLLCAFTILWMSGTLLVFCAQLPSVPASFMAPARNFQAISTTPAVFAMFVILARRQRRISEERAELQSEMKAAQEMQRLLVPATLDVEPWLAVEVAYFPAKEVGGDFYFCRRTPAGQLIVVGDVSGKGLKAAMMASTMVGALRNEDATGPAEVLQRLNHVVLRSNAGGFVTCLCALFHADGTLTFANAGHLSPYRNGVELFSPGGLPLGILADMAYESTEVAVAPGEMVTMQSDGVVEAANAHGELFGFDRTREISGRSAQEIAETAKAWGQNDDITVVTVRHLAMLL